MPSQRKPPITSSRFLALHVALGLGFLALFALIPPIEGRAYLSAPSGGQLSGTALRWQSGNFSVYQPTSNSEFMRFNDAGATLNSYFNLRYTSAGNALVIEPGGSAANLLLQGVGGGGVTIPTASTTTLTAGTNTAPGSVQLNGQNNGQPSFRMRTASLDRWVFYHGGSESTGNVGSNFVLSAYDDAAAFLYSPLTITRSTGLVTMAKGAAITGGTLENATIGATTPGAANFTTARLVATTVAGLPACSGGTRGMTAVVNDATAPAWNVTIAGGGAVTIPVLCNSTNWVAF